MVLRTQCPDCGRQFPVGDDLLGKPVRCPGCGEVSTASPAQAEAIVQRPEPPRPAPARTAPARLRPEPPPRRRSRPEPEPRRRGGSTGALVLGILSLVIGVPALGISWVPIICVLSMVAAGVGLLLAFIGIVVALAQRRSGVGLPAAGGAVNLFALIVAVVVMVLTSAVISNLPDVVPSPSDSTPEGAGVAGWGEVVNPDRDCTITPQGPVLRIDVPATPHDLSVEMRQTSAPRVLQEVNGDFSVQVKVCGTIHPTAPPAVAGHVSFQSGGLLLWSNEQNFHRLERAGMNRNGAVQTSAFLESRMNGQTALSQSFGLPERDVFLRVERRGNQILNAFSQDGRNWTPLRPVNLNLPAKVRVGVAAINAAQQPLSVRYEEFRLEKK